MVGELLDAPCRSHIRIPVKDCCSSYKTNLSYPERVQEQPSRILPECCRRRCRLRAESASDSVEYLVCFEHSSTCRSTVGRARQLPSALERRGLHRLLRQCHSVSWRDGRDELRLASPQCSAFSSVAETTGAVVAGQDSVWMASQRQPPRIPPSGRNVEAKQTYSPHFPGRHDDYHCYHQHCALHQPMKCQNRSKPHEDC